ncbi:KH domain-containing protein [Deinococcus lacus]|uniref:KH domain-containing protein n=1 Tax=Deinococcus lacus TaxID=392561 RepID=A0ABW1YAQ5_9DEIO
MKVDVQELTLFLAQHVVDEPQQVSVERRGQALLIDVAPGEEGRVIGRGGRVIQAIRTLVRAAAPQSRLSIDLRGNRL